MSLSKQVAIVTGAGVFGDSSLAGQWESQSSGGVIAIQSFTGTTTGDLIELLETSRTFAGTFEGSCDLSPPLSVTVTVN